MDLNTNNSSNCNGIRTNFSRANSAANILELGEETTANAIRDIHPTIKITNLTSSSSKAIPNGNLRRSYMSVNLDDANDVVWKRKSELNLNNKDENEFVNVTNVTQLHHQQQKQQQKKNIHNSSIQNFNDFSNEHFITVPTRRKCINTKAQTENNYLVWITPVAARYVNVVLLIRNYMGIFPFTQTKSTDV